MNLRDQLKICWVEGKLVCMKILLDAALIIYHCQLGKNGNINGKCGSKVESINTESFLLSYYVYFYYFFINTFYCKIFSYFDI